MRISDWSSYVCSSDLQTRLDQIGSQLLEIRRARIGWVVPSISGGLDYCSDLGDEVDKEFGRVWLSESQLEKYRADVDWRSEERRVGEECVHKSKPGC